MATLINIYNGAIALIGGEPMSSTDEASNIGQVARARWPIVRDAVLRVHPWNCATARVSLARLADPPAFGFDYQYQMPTNCLSVLMVTSGDYPIQYEIEGRKILTDADSVDLKYVAKLTDVSQYDSKLVDLMTAKLAADIAYSIHGNSQMAQTLAQMASIKEREAIGMDTRESSSLYHEPGWADRNG